MKFWKVSVLHCVRAIEMKSCVGNIYDVNNAIMRTEINKENINM